MGARAPQEKADTEGKAVTEGTKATEGRACTEGKGATGGQGGTERKGATEGQAVTESELAELLSETALAAVRTVEREGLGICAKCRWTHGCLKCDGEKALR